MRTGSRVEYTGERCIPGLSGIWSEAHHLSRYHFAAQYVLGKRVLDVGCGVGYGTALLAEQTRSIVGVDISSDSLSFARREYRHENALYMTMDCRQIGFRAASFDVVISFEVIEHLLEQGRFLREIRRILSPNGVLLISTPEKEKYNKFITDNNPFHVKELYESEFSELLSDHFGHVKLFWQAVNPVALDLLNLHNSVERLEKRIIRWERLFRRPWIPIAERLASGWFRASGASTYQRGNGLTNRVSNKTTRSSWFKENLFSVQQVETPDAIYMIAVCHE